MLTLPAQASCTVHSVSDYSKSTIKRRTKKDYAVMITAVRKGYEQLTVSDKYVYQILTEYDFEDSVTGSCKGYIFPDLKTVAADYNLQHRVIYRNLVNIERAGLIKRIRRQYRGSIIWLLDISEELLSTYSNERHLPKMTNVYKRNLLNNRRIVANVGNVDFLFSARQHTCYERLLSWGYHPTQAIRDITNPEIGAQKVEQRLADLHTLISTGWTPRQTFAQWLNWALRSDEQIATKDTKSFPSVDRPPQPKLDLAGFEEYEDEQGYTNYRPKSDDVGKALDSSTAHPATPTSSDVPAVVFDRNSMAVIAPSTRGDELVIVKRCTNKIVCLDYQNYAMIDCDVCYCLYSINLPFLEGRYWGTDVNLPLPAALFRSFYASLKFLTFSHTALLNYVSLHFVREGQEYEREQKRRGAG